MDKSLPPKPSSSVFHYSARKRTTCLDPSLAAIILTFAIREVDVVQAPPHLPPDRATALATSRPGPTIQDYEVIAALRTPLYADRCNTRHRAELYHLLAAPAAAFPWTSSTLEGVWEGMYMMASVQTASIDEGSTACEAKDYDYLCRVPMQCSIDLFKEDSSPFDSISGRERWSLAAPQSEPYEDEFHAREDTQPRSLDVDKPCQDFPDGDEILTGQTLEEHEQAWGGFRFFGRASSDGSIGLTRVQKDSSQGGGVWIFEGKICYGSAFVGRWRSSGSRGTVRGIFSMRKTTKEVR